MPEDTGGARPCSRSVGGCEEGRCRLGACGGLKEATHEGVVLTDGESVETRTLVWCVGVRPDP
ncbi:hypothetical protein AB0E85_38380, partial [Streptomyces sp. NPDC029044]|uniref:hypothetical protein n=1 Tax=Streptomyces sp. NPDC029044 TaxID=3157198 RepID=UPI0033EF0A0F